MLMTTDSPTARNLTPQEIAILDAIRSAGAQGITRAEIGAALGKAINKWDLELLARLEDADYITSAIRPGKRPNMLEYVYFATDR